MAFRAAASSGQMQFMDLLLDWLTTFGTCWNSAHGTELHDAERRNAMDVATLVLALGADIGAVDDEC